MRAFILAAAVAVLALPAGAQAASVTGETVSVPRPGGDTSVGCADQTSRVLCFIYSGAKATLNGNATQDDGVTPLAAGTVLRLVALHPRTAVAAEAATRTLDGVATTWSFQPAVKVGTVFRVDVVEADAVTGSSRPLFVIAQARIIDTSRSAQRGSRFTLKGKVQMAPSFGGGTLTVQRCKKRAANRCRLSKNGDWRPAILKRKLARAGSFTTTLVRPGSGRWYFRTTFNAKLARNEDTVTGFSIRWS